MKKYDVIRKELVDVVRNRQGMEVCSDSRELCISSEVALDLRDLTEVSFCSKYPVSGKKYHAFRNRLPDDLEPVIDDRIGYKDEDRIRDISQWDEGIPLSGLNISQEDKQAIRRARKFNKKDYNL